jgi:hypothetical protein
LAAARAVDEHDDTDSRALAVDAELHAVCEPLFWDSAEQDGTRLERWRRPAPARTARPPRPAWDRVTNAEANPAAQRDPVVWRAFTRAQQLLEPPAAVLRHPDTVARVRAVLESGWHPPAPPAPSHDELVALAGEARLALEPSG